MAARILVVDDEPAIRQIVTRALSEEGYEVVDCPNGQDAFEAALSSDFDLVVTNNCMPGMNGAELVTRLQGRFPRLPILHLDDVSRATRPEFQVPHSVPTIFKPFSLEALQQAVRKLLAH